MAARALARAPKRRGWTILSCGLWSACLEVAVHQRGLVESVLFIDYAATVKLLSVTDAIAIWRRRLSACMPRQFGAKWSVPPSQKLDVGAPFHNHWHVKTVILEDEPVRRRAALYLLRRRVPQHWIGQLDCARCAIVISDPGHRAATWPFSTSTGPVDPQRRRRRGGAPSRLGPKAHRYLGPGRRRHHGGETACAACSTSTASARSSARRGARRLRAGLRDQMVGEKLGVRCAQSTASRRWCLPSTSRSAARPAPTS